MRPLTIALCLHGYFPDQFFGTAVYARQLAEALQRRGNRVVIVAPRFDASLDHPRLSEPEWLGGIEIRRVLRPRMRGMRDTFDDPRLMPLLRKTFSTIGADIDLALGVVNVFDKAPPLAQFALGYDPVVADPRGRVFSVGLTKRF